MRQSHYRDSSRMHSVVCVLPSQEQVSLRSARYATILPHLLVLDRLVMRIVHSRRPLVLASPSRECALIRATLSRSQADSVLFLLTKPAREPRSFHVL